MTFLFWSQSNSGLSPTCDIDGAAVTTRIHVLRSPAGVVCVEVVPGEMLGLLPHRRLLPEAVRGPAGLERVVPSFRKRRWTWPLSGRRLLPWRYTTKYFKTNDWWSDIWDLCIRVLFLVTEKQVRCHDASYMQSPLWFRFPLPCHSLTPPPPPGRRVSCVWHTHDDRMSEHAQFLVVRVTF